MATPEEILSTNLRKFRGNRTQAAIAEAVNMPLRTYQRIEGGTIPRKFQYIEALAKLHRVTVDRLFIRDEHHDQAWAHLYNTQAIANLNNQVQQLEDELGVTRKTLTSALARAEKAETLLTAENGQLKSRISELEAKATNPAQEILDHIGAHDLAGQLRDRPALVQALAALATLDNSDVLDFVSEIKGFAAALGRTKGEPSALAPNHLKKKFSG